MTATVGAQITLCDSELPLSGRSDVTGESGPSVTSRIVALPRAFDPHRALTLTALARRSGLPLTTTHRLVAELVGGGLLARSRAGSTSSGARCGTWGCSHRCRRAFGTL